MVCGIGIGLRPDIHDEVNSILKYTDFIECNMGNDVTLMKEELAPFMNEIPIVIHSLNLSLGSVESPPMYRVDRLKQAVEHVQPPWVSEHLSFSRHNDIEISSFIPLPYIDEAVDVVSKNIRNLKQELNVPIAMENITHGFKWPGSTYSEVEFITKVLQTADCGLLLDLTNLYINSNNLKYNPYDYLESLPKDRIMQLHVAGHGEVNGKLVDSHVGEIHPEVLGYLEWILNHTDCNAVLIERDSDLTQFNDILPDIKTCKEIYNKYRPTVIYA